MSFETDKSGTIVIEDGFAKGDFAEYIQAVRYVLGLSQYKLACHLGVHKRTIQRYETGERQPSTEMLIKISKFLGQKISKLASDPRYENLQIPKQEPPEDTIDSVLVAQLRYLNTVKDLIGRKEFLKT